MTDLKLLAKNQILDNVVRAIKPANGWKVLIVDKEALRVISSCCRMYDLMDEGVSIVEDLTKGRQPMKTYEAVYFMAPTSENVSFLKSDFVPRAKYACAHVVFIDSAPDALLQEMAHPLLKKAIRSVKELNLSFVPQEGRVFTTNNDMGLYDFYSSYSGGANLKALAAHIADVCATLGEAPLVRFPQDSRDLVALAQHVQKKIDELTPYSAPMQQSAKAKKSQIILLDRGFDAATPLLHEMTYQAAAHDMCGVKSDNMYKYLYDDAAGKRREKKVVLGENDELWDEFRHEHISQVLAGVSSKFKQFQAEHEQKDSSNKSSTAQLRDLMQSMPQTQAQVAMYSLHLDLAAKILKAFSDIVEKVTIAEQDMVTGEDSTGSKVKEYVECIAEIIGNPKVTQDNKIRALLLCVAASGGLKTDQLAQLFRLSEIPVDKRAAIYNLKLLGLQVETEKKVKKKKSDRKKRAWTYTVSRWVPVLKDILEDAADGTLSLSDYPCVRDKPNIVAKSRAASAEEPVTSARRGGWAKGRKDKDRGYGTSSELSSNEVEGRIIVFIVGAISYSEMRVAYEVSKDRGWDVFIGSHAIMNPKEFLENMNKLHENLRPVDPYQPGAGGAVVAGAAGGAGGTDGSLTFVKGTALANPQQVHDI